MSAHDVCRASRRTADRGRLLLSLGQLCLVTWTDCRACLVSCPCVFVRSLDGSSRAVCPARVLVSRRSRELDVTMAPPRAHCRAAHPPSAGQPPGLSPYGSAAALPPRGGPRGSSMVPPYGAQSPVHTPHAHPATRTFANSMPLPPAYVHARPLACTSSPVPFNLAFSQDAATSLCVIDAPGRVLIPRTLVSYVAKRVHVSSVGVG